MICLPIVCPFRGQQAANRRPADFQAAGDLGFANASAVELSDLASLFPNSHGPAEVLSLEPRFGNAGADSFADDLVFKGGEYGQEAGHCAAGRCCQIERFGERYESDTKLR
jgi:hypothetical protein